jgi:hypothetical protein
VTAPFAPPSPRTDPETEAIIRRVLDRAGLTTTLTNQVAALSGAETYDPLWTGSVSNPSIGNGTLSGRYIRFGKLVHVIVNVTAGSTTTYGSGNYTLSLPVNAETTLRQLLQADLLDVTNQHYTGKAILNGTTTTEEILVGSNATGPTNWSPTAPFTFGTGDRLVISGLYETS